MEAPDMQEGSLQKQRRNLIITCILMLLYYVGGGSFGSPNDAEFDISGGKFHLANPQVIIAFGWIILLYFTWRYWLYAKDQHRLAHDAYFLIYRQDLSLIKFLEAETKSKLPMPLHQALDVNSETADRIKLPPLSFSVDRIGNFKYKAQMFYALENDNGDLQRIRNTPLEIEIAFYRVVPLLIKSYIAFALSKQEFSDLLVPYIVATFTIMVCGYLQLFCR
ncbi:MAG: hypothetical protein HY067_09655 [Betaproteobacteria bacterium]|nr:hypothetical protein [Betaproteobacteria bacterium]